MCRKYITARQTTDDNTIRRRKKSELREGLLRQEYRHTSITFICLLLEVDYFRLHRKMFYDKASKCERLLNISQVITFPLAKFYV